MSEFTCGPSIRNQHRAQSRRENGTDPAGAHSTIRLSPYLDDGWNRIAEYSGQSLQKTYIWGMDLSGTMQGAGGVGGLLAMRSGTSGPIYYPTYDGNGNITEYLAYTGSVAAHIEYDPFGNLAGGTAPSDQFAFRFSTKPVDPVTGLYYYGYRWYDPLTGRWPSRDPIAERGGVNLYGFVGNDGIGRWDYVGLATFIVNGAVTTTDSGPKCDCDRAEIYKKIAEFSIIAYEKSKNDYNTLVPAHVKANKLSTATGREWGGRICCNRKTKEIVATGPDHSTTGPNGDGWNYPNGKTPLGEEIWIGTEVNIDVLPKCPEGTDEVGRYHTHPYREDIVDPKFSQGDRDKSGSRFPFGVTGGGGTVYIIEPIDVGTHDQIADDGTVIGEIDDPTKWRGWKVDPRTGGVVPAVVVPVPGGGHVGELDNPRVTPRTHP